MLPGPWPLLVAALLATTAFAAPSITFESDRFGSVFVAGETPRLRVTVTADESGFRGKLGLQAHDAYGLWAGGAIARLHLEPHAAVTRDFELQTERLGHFTLSATLAPRRGRRSETTTSLAIVPPLRDSAAADSAIGYFVYPEERAVDSAPAVAAQMRRLGIRWVRLYYLWWQDARVLPPRRTDPAWLDTTTFERWVDAFRGEGIEVLATLFGTARWASSLAETTPIEGIPRWGLGAPRDQGVWHDVVTTLAQRLAGRVRYWELWNEPDIPLFWQSSTAEFTALLRTTADALRRVDPDARLVVNFVPDSVGLDPFELEVLDTTRDVLDVIGWHYGHDQTVATALRFLPGMRPDAAIWDTEALGAPRRHITQWLLQRAAGAQRIFPFVYHLPYDDAGSAWERFGRYPVNVDYTPRTDAIALRTLSDQVGEATTIVRSEAGLGYAAFAATGACCDGTTVLADMNQPGVTWSGYPGVTLQLKVPAAVQRLVVTDLMGNAQTIGVRRGKARLRLLGVAAFLRAEPPGSLREVRVVRARARRR